MTTTLSEITSRLYVPEKKVPKPPEMKVLIAPMAAKSSKLHDAYEAEVFNYLLANREPLGIKKVFQFKNLWVDGAVELSNNRRLALEIKFRMNWLKACQAGS